MKQRYRLDISYDGSDYAGWQIQPNEVTVQGTIEQALAHISGTQRCPLHGSGRTDQGVHAHRQVAHTDLSIDIPTEGLQRCLNGILPPDIRILRACKVSTSFHSRKSAAAKEYRYMIWNGAILPPVLQRYRTHIRPRLDITAMREGAAMLTGRHDFASFTANSKRKVDTTVRLLSQLSVSRRGDEILIVARGKGFLYKMVRSLSGILIRAGEGAVSPRDVRRILRAEKRTTEVPTAPPQGLFLWKVTY